MIWTETNPCSIPPGRLIQMFENSRDAYLSKCHSELIVGWREDPDAPSEEFFGVDDNELS